MRKQGSGDWIIRVYGKLSRPELHANERIRVVEYAVWIEFVRDCLTQSTGFMVYDGRLSATETANEQRRLKRLSKIAQERNVLWAYVQSSQQQSLEPNVHQALPDGCLLLFGQEENSVEDVWWMLENAYEVATHAERVLLNNALVHTAEERKLMQSLHRIWRQEFAAYAKRRAAAAAKGAEALQKLSQTNVQHVLNALCLGIHTAQVQGWSYESVEDLFTHYCRREMAIRLSEVWMSWMLATENFQAKQMLG